MPKPRQRRQKRTQQAILDAALQIITQQGSDQLSMRAIAEQIDYSPAGIYEYFNSKEEIIQALISEGHRRLTAYLRQVDENLPPAEYLLEIGLAYIDFALRNREHYLLMFTNTPSEIQLEDLLREGSSFPILLKAIQSGIDHEVFEARPGFGAQEMAYAAWALVHGISMLRLTYLGKFDLDFSTADREALLAFNHGLRAG